MISKEFQEKLDALSDEFQSTFRLENERMLVNMFDAKEIPVIKKLVQKHFGWKQVAFMKSEEFDGESYDIWFVMEVK